MIPPKCCPKCKEIAVGTFAFNGWELFCPDCKIGAGMFNDWPVAEDWTEDEQDSRQKHFSAMLEAGAYLSLNNLADSLRTRIQANLDESAKRLRGGK